MPVAIHTHTLCIVAPHGHTKTANRQQKGGTEHEYPSPHHSDTHPLHQQGYHMKYTNHHHPPFVSSQSSPLPLSHSSKALLRQHLYDYIRQYVHTCIGPSMGTMYAVGLHQRTVTCHTSCSTASARLNTDYLSPLLWYSRLDLNQRFCPEKAAS